MRPFRTLFLAVLAAGPLACSRGPTLDTRTFPLHYMTRDQAQAIIAPYVFTDRPNAPGKLSASDDAITVRETPDNLDKIARVLAQYDRRSPNVRLRFQVIEADGVSRTDSSIADVVAQLRKLFRFKGYRFVTQTQVTGTARSNISQMLDGGQTLGGMVLQVGIRQVRGSGDSATVDMAVQLGSLRGMGKLETEVAARIGQTVVIGSTQMLGQPGPIILTVRPELVAE